MNSIPRHIILCNGASLPPVLCEPCESESLRLEYRATDSSRNVKLLLPDFVRDVYYLPAHILDLLEIAAYVYSADRFVSRGRKDALEYHSWSRSFDFVVKVRDFQFWEKPTIKKKLSDALCFVSGDCAYRFTFQPGHSTPPTSLFDEEQFKLDPQDHISVVLFSGGLDSLAGVIDRLNNSTDKICLVSHRSGQPETRRTQKKLFEALKQQWPDRVQHYSFYCSLTGNRAIEESQRTRSFLYTSIAYALSHTVGQRSFFVYENGITSINLPRRQDLMNARASRTSHPKTISLFEDLFSEIEGSPIKIETPFLLKTKTDILRMLAELGQQDLISSAVSCSKTFQNIGQSTHCGGCFQCIDRRFAAYGSELDEIDESGIYGQDFIRTPIEDPEVRTTLIDYVRQAIRFAKSNLDRFYLENLEELADIIEYMPGMDEEKALEEIWKLCQRHGQQVGKALVRMRDVFDRPFELIPRDTLLRLIADREYLKEPIDRLVEDICTRLKSAIPIAFPQNNLPKDETDFNNKVSALLQSYKGNFEREHPAVSFALTHPTPDHSHNQYV